MSWNHVSAGRANTIGIEYLDGLYSYALVLTRNQAEAADLVQETYVRAMPAMERLGADSNTKAWLLTILRNVWLNQVRRRRHGPQMIQTELGDGIASSLIDPSAAPHDLYVSKIEAEQVRAAIQELPVQFCEVILLREYEDLSYCKIEKDKTPDCTLQQAVLGFNVTLDPPRIANDAVAVVEVTLKQATQPSASNCTKPEGCQTANGSGFSLVAMMPKEKSYNAAALTSSSHAFSGSVLAGAYQLSGACENEIRASIFIKIRTQLLIRG